jgi:hypothetical protein
MQNNENTFAPRRDRLQDSIDEGAIFRVKLDSRLFFGEHLFEKGIEISWDFHVEMQPSQRDVLRISSAG